MANKLEVGAKKIPFCKAPWHAISLAPNGQYGPCCIIQNGFGDSKTRTIKEAWHSVEMRDFRRRLLDGDLPEGCVLCQGKEELGVRSVRSYYEEIAAGGESVIEDYTLEFSEENIRHLDISLSNKCNLKCRFCFSGNSTAWFADRDSVSQDPVAQNIFGEWLGNTKDIIDVPPESLVPFIESLPQLKQMEIKGGEPFLSQGHKPLLQALIASGQAHQLTLLYNSNLTVVKYDAVKLWENFNRVCLGVSVDGLDEVYKYVRGGRFSFEHHVYPAVKKIRDLHLPNLQMSYHYTISAYNLVGLVPFIDWLVREEPPMDVSFGQVTTPPHLSAGILPTSLIESTCQQLEKYSGQVRRLPGLIQGLRNFPQERNVKLEKMFYHATKKIDELRNQHLADCIPELAPFYKELEQRFADSGLESTP